MPEIYLSANGHKWVEYTSFQKLCAVEAVYERMARKDEDFAKNYFAGKYELSTGAAVLDWWYGELETSPPFSSQEEQDFIMNLPLTKVVRDWFGKPKETQ